MNSKFQEMIDRIKNESSVDVEAQVVLLPHISIDGDALGSTTALRLLLLNFGITADIIAEETLPSNFEFLPGFSEIKVLSKDEIDQLADNGKCVCAIAVDCGDLKRMGKRSKLFTSANFTGNIDHHVTNTLDSQYTSIYETASSTGEIIFKLIDGDQISKDISTCLYTSIISDTGGFKYGNITRDTCYAIGELISAGINFQDIYSAVFETTTFEKIKIEGFAAESLELIDDKIAVSFVTLEQIRIAGVDDNDFEGIVNIARNVPGVIACAFLREYSGGVIRANLRSRSDEVDVAKIASSLGGGGHKRAAGFTIAGDLFEIKNMLVEKIRGGIS
jgi:phosphoesterase RecJ-like protein